MAHDAVGRLDAEVLANFANGRPIAARFDFLANELVNLALPVCQLAEIGHVGTPCKMNCGKRLVSKAYLPCNVLPFPLREHFLAASTTCPFFTDIFALYW